MDIAESEISNYKVICKLTSKYIAGLKKEMGTVMQVGAQAKKEYYDIIKLKEMVLKGASEKVGKKVDESLELAREDINQMYYRCKEASI